MTKKNQKPRKITLTFLFIIVVAVSFVGGALGEKLVGYKLLDRWFSDQHIVSEEGKVVEQKVLKEESVVVDVVDKVSPSVVTVGVKKTKRIIDPFDSFFDPFGFFGMPDRNLREREEEIEQDIGSGFVIDKEGLVVTNKHVVSDPEAEYKVITNQGDEYKVENIYRDAAIDLAILKINSSAGKLKPIQLGDSEKLKVGQFVIAIGTALGEFRNTVTTGVVSGLGRGITAGDPFGGYTEELENVIQTDAAINPGNSGGPLLNSLGQVIGVNVATTSGAENIGFAIPIDIVKDALDNFKKTGKFSRPFLGVRYKMISKELAILNEIPEGAYVVEVVDDSPADKAGVQKGDIIVKINGDKITGSGGLAKKIQTLKVGERVGIEVWRDEKVVELQAELKES